MWCEIFPSLSTEQKDLFFWDQFMCLIDSPCRDEDTLQVRVTCLPHSAVILGVTFSFTNSVDKDTNIVLRFKGNKIFLLV